MLPEILKVLMMISIKTQYIK